MQPEKLGPFQIGRILGRGGMGAVYEGVHCETGETAAVKVLLSNLEDDSELRIRFEAEIDTLKRLRHPNIVKLFGFGEEQGILYYVMEMINGPSLYQEIKRQRLFQWHEVAKIGLEMCFALKHGHDRGITHRDIKPANILLDPEGMIKLSDYGIAHFFGAQRLTEIHSVVGTLEYMSPEQSLANPIGPKSDLYSLGAVLYMLLAGKPPFIARNLAEIIRKHQKNDLGSIRTIRLDVPDELEAIIFDLLKIRPEDRPHNAYLAAKRFQSLLQALVGPPEKIFVKPMTNDSPTTTGLTPVRIPYNGEPSKENIGRARGFISENGIIDLGGIVDATQTSPATPPSESDSIGINEQKGTSLIESFGRPGMGVSETPTIEAARLPASFLDEADRSAFSLSVEPIDLINPADEPTVIEKISEQPLSDMPMVRDLDENEAKQIREDYRRLHIPLPEDVEKLFSDKKNETPEKCLSDSWSFSVSEPQTATEFKASSSSKQKDAGFEIHHGEIVFDDAPAFRRSKDEPLPDVNVFDALRRNQEDPATDVEKEDEKTNEKQAVAPNAEVYDVNEKTASDGDFIGYDLAEPIPKNTASKRQDKPTVVDGVTPMEIPEPPPIGLYDLKTADDNKVGEMNSIASTAPKEQKTAKSSSTTSHFVSVKDKVFDEFEDPSAKDRPIISLQTIFASICLLLLGPVFWYLLQPISPDALYERIKTTVEEGTREGDVSFAALRRAEKDIQDFLFEYSQHPKAENVQRYKEDLEIGALEQKLERRQQWIDQKKLPPYERAYMDAISTVRSDPERTIAKLKALIDLYSSDVEIQPVTDDLLNEKTLYDNSDEEKSVKRQQRKSMSSLSENCVLLAQRRLAQLEEDLHVIVSDQRNKIIERLNDADHLHEKHPERAQAIRNAVVELYGDRRWARDLVDQAREKLKTNCDL